MSHHAGALGPAEAQVAAVRDNPAARLALMARVFRGPTGRAPRHLPFRRAALSFMRWQARRGVLNPLDASPPGSVWWRAVNERLLRDGCETVALLGGLAGEPSSQAVRLWLAFGARPTGRNWYRAHNASIVGGYLEHRDLAEAESAPERFFMNVALARVLYAHALVAAPRLALGRLAPLGRLFGDPRLGMAGVFLSLGRVLPDRYPLDRDVERYIAQEQRLGRMLDYAVIVPRLQRLYEWSAEELSEPRLLGLVRDGSPIYAWPFEERHVWRTGEMPFAGRVLERVTRRVERSVAHASLDGDVRRRACVTVSRRSSGPAARRAASARIDGDDSSVRDGEHRRPRRARRRASTTSPAAPLMSAGVMRRPSCAVEQCLADHCGRPGLRAIRQRRRRRAGPPRGRERRAVPRSRRRARPRGRH